MITRPSVPQYLFAALLAAALVLTATARPAAGGYREGMALYARCQFTAAAVEFQPAAEKGSARAQYMLGRLYVDGKGVARDPAVGTDWFRRSAEQGFVRAQYALGALLYERRDHAGAQTWWLRAARAGSAEAMTSLGFLYADASTGQRDYVQARMWYELASRHGAPDSFRLRAALDRSLSTAQVSKALQLAQRWQPAAPTY